MQAWTSQAALQASDDGRADNTAGMLTCQKPLQLEEKKMLPTKCHQVNLNRNRIPAESSHIWSAGSFSAARCLYLAALQSSDYF